jgi:hypothetical protein
MLMPLSRSSGTVMAEVGEHQQNCCFSWDSHQVAVSFPTSIWSRNWTERNIQQQLQYLISPFHEYFPTGIQKESFEVHPKETEFCINSTR